ncbi:hypothetical protein O3P69_002243 [Scylla paramamosain]|uniref:Reverse transcriptase domain-containing protein n=1 Tax=Scylla paramamosain TaxID=85552 RepID=A0AAW0SCZ2_SCYPA
MGFVATGDEFCRRGDAALDGVQQCAKVVDDILLWDEDYETHIRRVYEVLVRCRTHGITINAEKFVLAAPDVTFCGFKLSREGIAADEEKTDASRLYGVGYALLQDHGDEWRKGKSLAIPDALSRAPVDKPSPEDVALGKEAYAHVRVVVAIRAATLDARSPTGDLVLDGIRTAAREDVIYTRLLELQDPVTKRWDKVGVVMGIGKSRDYLVKTTAGRVLWRNRRFIRVVPAPSTAERDSHDGQPLHPPAQKIPDPATPNARRRRRWEADGPIRRSARIALRS